MTCRLVAMALLLLLAAPPAARTVVAQEPSLAELAAREKARRKALQKEKGEGRSFTDKDLKPDSEKSSTPAPAANEAAPEAATPRKVAKPGRAAGGGAKSEVGESAYGEDDAEHTPSSQQGWAKRATALREKIAVTEARIPELEKQITELQLDNSPNPADMMDPMRLQKRASEVARLKEEVEKARTEVESLRAAYAALLEEARRNDIPLAWLEGPAD